jgi:hypothetical protein
VVEGISANVIGLDQLWLRIMDDPVIRFDFHSPRITLDSFASSPSPASQIIA